jgi:glutathione S-transferase
MEPVLLFQPPAAWGEPSMSPFAIKLQCYLRIAGIPYETRRPNLLKAPKGKVPYVALDGKLIGDSQCIIAALVEKYGDRVDHWLCPEQRALAQVARHALEEWGYFLGLHGRWVDPGGWEVVRPAFVRTAGVPAFLMPLIRRRVIGMLHAQGAGRHAPEEIHRMGIETWSALATLLGEKPYFLGEQVSSIDAVLFAFTTAYTVFPHDSPPRQFVLGRSNLIAHRDRLQQRYFSAAS